MDYKTGKLLEDIKYDLQEILREQKISEGAENAINIVIMNINEHLEK